MGIFFWGEIHGDAGGAKGGFGLAITLDEGNVELVDKFCHDLRLDRGRADLDAANLLEALKVVVE